MKKGTFRFIIVLVALLFVNIEAAQAGLIHRFKIFIRAEFPDHQFIYLLVLTGVLGFISYVIMAPVPIGAEKWSKLDYYSKTRKRHTYKVRRISVNRISELLKSTETINSPHF